MLLIADGIKYKPYEYKNEEELEGYVKECAKYIFGEESLYIEKKRISSLSGVTSIPDGYAITFDPPQWYVVEVELSRHDVDDHIVSQLSRFIRGINNPTERRNLTEYIYNEVIRNQDINNKLKERYSDVHKCVSDIINKDPIILIIIDERTDKLDEAISSIKAEIKIIEFKTFEREGVGIAIRAHLFEPVVESTKHEQLTKSEAAINKFVLPLLEVLIEMEGKSKSKSKSKSKRYTR